MTRRIGPLIGALLVLLAFAPPAYACSCFRGDPRTQLEQSDGAFIGRLRYADPAPNSPTTTYHFDVDEVFKGDIGKAVDVRSSTSGASCGFEVQRGQQMGFFLQRENGVWTGGLCGQVSPDDLRKAARPYPKPDGSGDLALLVGGRYGDVRTMGLDAQGRTLAYGKGDGKTTHLSVCPGGRFAAEVARTFAEADDLRAYVVLRDLETFAGVRKVLLEGLEAPGAGHYPLEVGALACRSSSGDDVVVYAANGEADQTEATGKLIRVTPDEQSVLFEGGLGGAAAIPASGSFAYVATRTDKLIEVNVATRAVRDIAKIKGPLESGPVVSPDGRSIAMQRPQEGGTDLYDVRTGSVVTNTRAKGYRMVWASDQRLVVTGAEDNGVLVLDRSLEQVGAWKGWTGDKTITDDGKLYGTNWEGQLVSAPALSGPMKIVRTFDSPELDVIAAVPERTADDAPTAPVKTQAPGPQQTTEPTAAPPATPTPSPAGFAAPTSAPSEPAGSAALPAAAVAVSALALGGAAFTTWRRRAV